MIRSVDVDYDWSIFLDGNYDIPAYSCATYQPQDTPDIYEPYGGFPESYVLENTTIYQLWWDDKKLFNDLGKLLDIEVVSISSIKQPCGSTVALDIEIISIKLEHSFQMILEITLEPLFT